MSVTFTIPTAPYKTVPCPYCERDWADFPEGNGRGGRCDPFCTGVQDEPEAPELNLSNRNAANILGLLGFDTNDELSGECSPETLRQAILRARNSDRSSAVVEPSDIAAGGVVVVRDDGGIARIERRGARVINLGYTDEDILDRLERLEQLAMYAQERGSEISWG